MSVPNQRIVQIAPRKKRNSENLYAMINLQALQTAMTELNGSSLKLWLYFNKNQNDYRLELSQKECSKWGIKKDSYYSAVRDLGLRGYLCPVKDGSNIFNFYEEARPSEVPKQAGNPNSAKQNSLSENQAPVPEIQKKHSETPERNNIDSTEIIQNNTICNQLEDEISKEEEYSLLAGFVNLLNPAVYGEDEIRSLHNFLQDAQYRNKPAQRVAQMTADERILLDLYFQRYIEHGAMKNPRCTIGGY